MKSRTKMSVDQLHKQNKKLILNLIRENGEISRSSVSSITKLTPPTVAKIIEELVDDGLVEYCGIGDSSGGRPPVVVKYRGNGNYIIGIDLGATFIRGCLLDLNANIISDIQIPTEIDSGADDIAERLVSIIDRFVSRNRDGGRIWGVGIGVAGLVERKSKTIAVSPVFGWENLDLRQKIMDKVNLPVFIENSTRLMALSELNFGNHESVSNFAVINVGFGIAAGLVIDRHLVKGECGYAGEFGHVVVAPESDVMCSCGKRGCLEAMASGRRIAELGRLYVENGGSGTISLLCNGNPSSVTAKSVGKACKMGDKAAMEIFSETSEYLAQAIGSMVNLLNLPEVYIGGGVSLNGDFYFSLLNDKVRKYLLPPNCRLKILPSTFGEHSTAIGAACMVLEKIMVLDMF